MRISLWESSANNFRSASVSSGRVGRSWKILPSEIEMVVSSSSGCEEIDKRCPVGNLGLETLMSAETIPYILILGLNAGWFSREAPLEEGFVPVAQHKSTEV